MASAAAISAAPTPKTVAAAAAASAFKTLWRPCSGSVTSASPPAARKRKRLRPTPIDSTPKARTSASRSMP